MSDSIRVQRPGKKIEVNDSGEYITLDLYDIGFMGHVLDLIKEFEGSVKNLSAQAETVSRESVDEVSELARKTAEECGKLAARIDEVFGADACRKIFGEGTPSLYELTDFFGQIGALLKKYSAEKDSEIAEKVAKYKAKYNRGGGD